MTSRSFLLVVLLAACTKVPAGGARTFRIQPVGATAPITVEAAIPPDWTVKETGNDPELQVPGVERSLITIAALSPAGTPDERMKRAIAAQYEDAAGAERENLPDGRVWMKRLEGTRLHARLFIPYADGVVMGVAMFPQAAAEKLPAIRAVFETIKVLK